MTVTSHAFDRVENPAVIGIVEKMLGVSKIKKSSGFLANKISLGQKVFEKDEINTTKSKVHVRFKENSYFELGYETSLQIERIRFKPANVLAAETSKDQFDETVFRFNYGLVRVISPDIHALEHYSIKSINAIIKVLEPSEFYLMQKEDERTLTISLVRGKIELISIVTNDRITLNQGYVAQVKVTGLLNIVKPLTQEEENVIKAQTKL